MIAGFWLFSYLHLITRWTALIRLARQLGGAWRILRPLLRFYYIIGLYLVLWGSMLPLSRVRFSQERETLGYSQRAARSRFYSRVGWKHCVTPARAAATSRGTLRDDTKNGCVAD